ncbi:putative XPG/Rad2 endonuclease, XPG-I domain, PIN-like domain superfamily, yen1, H3TH [Septoria linicola]|nr:putative XPG/Rad2 endonuclease, XPG-I domain, PIN-like domain superfamily, yen1, H3TH [Septoria linicola]
MGVSGLFKELGPGERVSVAKLAAHHFTTTGRPLRLAVDISIWLFQILASKGGSNPALRTFYYRLLRILSLHIHPLFVFDGPNKPTFKRNKRVGGPGVRVASVPEFLAKELLRKFGFPWHVAPGEAEAECALLQREGVVDAVLSEDVDTLMFGSGVLWRSWTAEGKGKVPTHCTVYRSDEVKEKSRLDKEGMILVALMSGGDYIVEGIPGCGPKVACDAARAGFGKDLCELARRRDVAGLKSWRERLQHEIKTNESKFFTRKSSKLEIPNDFPNREVLGYYTDPCVSTLDKVARLKAEVKWDLDVDFPALRSFAGDAFDWRCLGGAKKFIRNLAPAMLVRNLRIMGHTGRHLDIDTQAQLEQQNVLAIHGKRNHATTDGELEYRITFIPQSLVPIDLSIEDEDDDFVPAGGSDEDMEAEDEWAQIPSSTQDESDAPSSPTKKRVFKPYHPDQPEKLWIMRDFLKLGCPLLVEDYEDKSQDPKEFFKQRRKARAAAKGDSNMHAKKPRRKKNEPDPAQLSIDLFGTITKSSQASVEEACPSQEREPLKVGNTGANVRPKKRRAAQKEAEVDTGLRVSAQLPRKSTQERANSLLAYTFDTDDEETPKARKVNPPAKTDKEIFQQFAKQKLPASQRTPQRRKRRSDEIASPASGQRSILSWATPSPHKAAAPIPPSANIISLLSSSPVKAMDVPRPSSPTPERLQGGFPRDHSDDFVDFAQLPASVTKRRGKGPLVRAKTAPVVGQDEGDITRHRAADRPSTPDLPPLGETVEAMDLASPIAIRLFAPQPALAPLQDKTRKNSKPTVASSTRTSSGSTSTTLRRSPRQASKSSKSSAQPQLVTKVTKTKFIARESLPGAWKEVEAETLDLTGDGSGWAQSRGKATMVSAESSRVTTKGWRKSGVEVLDLTGA